MAYARQAKRVRYGLLRDAYNFLYSIPARSIYLDSICRLEPKIDKVGKGCGAIACGIGWLGLHPKFQKLGLRTQNGSTRVHGEYEDYDDAAAKIFGISRLEGNYMFAPITQAEKRSEKSHKQVLLNRIMKFLDEAGEVDEPKYL